MTRTSPPSEGRFGRGTRLFALTALATLALDQLTKSTVIRALPAGTSWPEADTLVGRFFSFTHVANTGVAFGMFQGRNALFIVVSLLVVASMLLYRRRMAADALWLNVAVGLIVGGALGNVIDRLRFGHVIDFFDFKFWPVFNVADMSVVAGVLLLTWCMWREERSRASSAPSEAEAPTTWAGAVEESSD